jgi:DNA-binding transcriptional regulator WhiA
MDDELFQVKMRTIATSPNKNRPKKIIEDISRLFNQYNYIGLNTIKFSKAKNLKKFAKNYVLRLFYDDKTLIESLTDFNKKTILNIKELSSIIHFPHGRFNQNPRIAWQKFKVVPAPDDLPSE